MAVLQERRALFLLKQSVRNSSSLDSIVPQNEVESNDRGLPILRDMVFLFDLAFPLEDLLHGDESFWLVL